MIAFSKSSKAIISWVSITLFVFCAFWNIAWQKADGNTETLGGGGLVCQKFIELLFIPH